MLFVCFTAHAPNQRALDQEAQGIHLKVTKPSSVSIAANTFALMAIVHYGSSLYFKILN